MSFANQASKSLLAIATIAGSLLTGACTTDEELANEDSQRAAASADELAAGVPVLLDGKMYSPAELAANEVGPLHYVSTYESIRDGYVMAFRSESQADAFRGGYPVSKRKAETASLFPRTHSKFYDLTGYSDKFLELGVGESAVDLSSHPCGCNNDISSLKASETATWTKIYDLPNLTGDSWAIPSGAEIDNLAIHFHNGFTWDQDISSIRVTN